MPKELLMIKQSGSSLLPVTDEDQRVFDSYRMGQAVRVELTQVSPRSLKYHKRYWAGLLGLASHYYEPVRDYIGASERKALIHYADWQERHSGNTGAAYASIHTYLQEQNSKRSNMLVLPEDKFNSSDELHLKIKKSLKMYDVVRTPDGLDKKYHSINFNAMGEEEFRLFYKKAFGVVWKMVFSRAFPSEEAAENAVCQLLEVA